MVSAWATDATAGQPLGIGGPRASHVVRTAFDGYLLAADETGLPALARWLRELPANVSVTALVEVLDHHDEQKLATSTNLTIRWLHRARGECLQHAVGGAVLPAGRLYSWVAAEASTVHAIRRHLLHERGLDPETVLARGYWKIGMEGDHEASDH
ncbi:MAG TPA: siderophore-interacting protein [Acidimicrobiia bacterium]